MPTLPHLTLLLALTCNFLVAVMGQAQEVETETRLTAPRLFPENTLAYIRVDDVTQLKQALDRSSLGKLGNDEKLKPIFSEFYGSLVRNTQELEDAVGLNLDELLSIPSGELAVALLPPDRGSAQQGG